MCINYISERHVRDEVEVLMERLEVAEVAIVLPLLALLHHL